MALENAYESTIIFYSFLFANIPAESTSYAPTFFSRTTGPNSTRLGKKHPWVKETQGFTNKDHSILKKKIMDFSISL